MGKKNLQVVGVLLGTFANSLVFTIIFPFASKLVMDFGMSNNRTTTGYWVGIITFSLMLGRTIASPVFGVLCDSWGRRPVQIIGLSSITVFSLMFGFSTNYWYAVIVRFVLGFFTPLTLVNKTLLIELVTEDQSPSIIAWYSMIWQFGNIMGNVLGGILVDPKSSGLIESGVFADYPYLLPNFIASMIGLVALLISFFLLEETLHTNEDQNKKESESSLWSIATDGTVSMILGIYILVSVNSTGFQEVISLWSWAKKENGGFEFSTERIGTVLGIGSFLLLFVQKKFHSYLVSKLGMLKLTNFSSGLMIPIFLLIPLGSFFRYSETLSWVAMMVSTVGFLLLNFFTLTGIIVLSNNAVVRKERGRLNGIFMTAGSLARAVSPLIFGNVFALTAESDWVYPFNFAFSFYLMAFFALCLWRLSLLLPFSITHKKETLLEHSSELTQCKV